MSTALAGTALRAWLSLLTVIALLAVTGVALAGPAREVARDASPADAAPVPTPTPTLTAAPLSSERTPDGADEVQPMELAPASTRLRTFVGLSTWIDVYDIEWTPEEQVDVAARGGVQAIYVQSARAVSEEHIEDPDRLARVIEAAHDRGIAVMVWYIPGFTDPAKDLARAQAAIDFTTPRGDRADAFGLDIELEDEADAAVRTRRLLELSRDLRDRVGPDYPMAAIVLPPLQLDLRPGWWPDFPYAELRAFYDVFVPMSYSSLRGSDPDTTYTWNLDNVGELRRRAGDPGLPVHLAGGIADNLPHVDAFVAAARDAGVLGAGLYDLHTTPVSSWTELRAVRAP